MNVFPTLAMPKCIIVTNLFGHPAYLSSMRSWCDSNNVIMIEDAAQSPFALENGKYAGTIGHIGVFSFNVHKHIQCGEGGVIVTDNDDFAGRLAGAINHGELSGFLPAGLNLRMTEPTAAIACAQLAKAEKIIPSRIEIGEALTEMAFDVPFVEPQLADVGCKHVYYCWAARVSDHKRSQFVRSLKDMGLPMRVGYSPLLTDVFHAHKSCPVASRMEHEELITFEVCAYDPKLRHLKKMREIFLKAAEEVK